MALPTVTKAQVSLNGISIGASYWQPSLDYWNNRSMLTAYNQGEGAKLMGAMMPTAGLEIGVVNGLTIGGRVGYWKQSAASALTVAGINRTEQFTLSLIPVSAELKYRFSLPVRSTTDGESKAPFLTPFVGVGLSRYFIKNEFSRQVVNNTGSVDEKQAGSANGVQALVGVEKKLVKKLYASLEARYHVSSYKQAVTTETGNTSETVSLNGLEANLSLRFKLAN